MATPKRPWRGSRLTYRIDEAAGIVEILGADPDSLREHEGVLLAVLADPAYRPGMGFLRDRRGSPPPSVHFIRAAVRIVEALPQLAGARGAVVVDDVASYGMIRMAEELAQVARIRVFRSVEEARAWLQESAAG